MTPNTGSIDHGVVDVNQEKAHGFDEKIAVRGESIVADEVGEERMEGKRRRQDKPRK